MSNIRYMPSLDGLRFLAYLAVFLFHADLILRMWSPAPEVILPLKLFGIGWIGVDVFFVLSGYLITAGILVNIDSPSFLRNFYTKRVLRIFPLYYLTCVFGLVIAPAVLPSAFAEAHKQLLEHWPVYFANVQNWWVSLGGKRAYYLGHFWSLAIEEQFYLFWPVALLLMRRTKFVVPICIVLIVLVIAGRVAVQFLFGTHAKFYLHFATTARVDALFIGCILALCWHPNAAPPPLESVLKFSLPTLTVAIYFLATFWPVAPFGDFATQSIGYTIIALGSAGIIALLQLPRANRTFLANPVMVYLGRISYGLYVFHWPVMYCFKSLFDAYEWHGNIAAIVFVLLSFVVTLALAAISYHAFERRFLKLRPKQARIEPDSRPAPASPHCEEAASSARSELS